MNHLVDQHDGHYRMPKHWRDKEDCPPESRKPKSKNEIKTPLFIFIKHLVEGITQDNAARIERYVVSYGRLDNASIVDKESIRKMFQEKLKTI